MQGLIDFLKKMGRGRLLIMGGVAALLLGVLGLVAFRGATPEMGFLYTDLDPAVASKISDELKTQNIPYQVSADGTAILVPRERLAELRMSLATQQLGAKMGYDILDTEEPFGVSASRAKINETRAIEGELARSISTLDSVSSARVHIVMPERELFATEPRKATAAVTVKTVGHLKPDQIDAVRYLVSSAVPELSPESVSIIDQNGTLLARAGEAGSAGGAGIEQQQEEAAARLRSQIEALLEPIYGAGKVRAEVAVQLERSQTREESEVYDPDKQVIQRQVTVESNNQDSETDAAPAATTTTISNQLPENAAPVGGQNGRNSQNSQNSEDTSYQNSVTRTLKVEAPGTIKRLTVAVNVDGGKGGVQQQQIQQLTRLVENAVGFDAERGDSVVVESMQFAKPQDVPPVATGLPLGISMDQIVNVLKLLIIAVVGIVVIRMLRGRAGAADPEMELAAAGGATPQTLDSLMAEAGLSGMISDQARSEAVAAAAEAAAAKKQELLGQLGGRVAADPTAAANVFRQWLNG